MCERPCVHNSYTHKYMPTNHNQEVPDASLDELIWTITAAAVMLTPYGIPVQSPPNLSDMGDLNALLAAGVSDWGGVSPITADFVNPERAW